jgi:hypothetical protein
MTPDTIIARRDALLEDIVTEKVNTRIPGQDDFDRFARDVTISALLGRFPAERAETVDEAAQSDGATCQASPVVMPGSPLLLSPDTPVETVPDSLPAGVEAPGEQPSGEPPEEKVDQEPPPLVEIAAVVDTETIAEKAARLYVEDCILRRQPINRSIVGTYLGTSVSADAQKFVSKVQDSINKRVTGRSEGYKGKEKQRQVAVGFERLMQAVGATPDDDDDEAEPSDEELLAEPRGQTRQTATRQTAAPRWWSESVARQCQNPECRKRLEPRRVAAGWESLTLYKKRDYCDRVCSGKGRSAKGAKPFRAQTTPEAVLA